MSDQGDQIVALTERCRALEAQAQSMNKERMYLYDRLAEIDPEYAATKAAVDDLNAAYVASLRTRLDEMT